MFYFIIVNVSLLNIITIIISDLLELKIARF